MSDSLIPERSIQFSPSLAASIGVEGAILLQHLQTLLDLKPENEARESKTVFNAIDVSYASLSKHLPFWNPEVIRRTLLNLHQLGMIQISRQPHTATDSFICIVNPDNQTRRGALEFNSTSVKSGRLTGANTITSAWRPESEALKLLAQSGISQQFALQQVDEFILYWQERGEISHAWSSKFVQHVNRQWTRQQQTLNENSARPQAGKLQPRNIDRQWTPSEDATEILQRMGISHNFITDAIPEFVLYWQERDEPQTSWNSKFVTHTKKQWARYTHTLKHDTEPRPMHGSWKPDPEVYDVLTLANIDHQFANTLVAEFIIYWRDRGELHHSWNTKFLQYVKFKWSRNHFQREATGSEVDRATTTERRTRDIPLAESLTDRSWAQ